MGAFGKCCTAQRRYAIRLFALMSLYLGFLIIAERFLDRAQPVTGVLAYVLGILPALPVIGVFWAVGRLLVETNDEYQRLLLVRQTLVATALAMTAATGWGFLENYELVPHIAAFYWAIIWFGGLGAGSLFNRLTLGDSGNCA